jgi:hypothetical protein
MLTRLFQPLAKRVAGAAIVVLVFALGLWVGWHKGEMSVRLQHAESEVASTTSTRSNAADQAMKLREQGLLKLEPRKPEELTPEERAIVAQDKKSNQWTPPEEICSKDNNYCVKMVLKPERPDECTLVVSSKGRVLAQFATIGYLLDVFYSPDSSYVTINNRRANAGDYLWVISLRDGKPLKIPEDLATNLKMSEFGHVRGDHSFGNVSPEVTALCPDQCTKDNLIHPFLFGRGWESPSELVILEELHFFHVEPSSDGLRSVPYGPGAPGTWIGVNKICRITEKGLSLVKQSVEKEAQPSEVVNRAWTFSPFHDLKH